MLAQCLLGQDKTLQMSNSYLCSCDNRESAIYSSQTSDFTAPPRNAPEKTEMYKTFQQWALRHYGDSAKTKTVTRKKYNRIVRILTGEEPATSENSKFRFWVKAKGFRLGPAPADGTHAPEDQVVYVPSKLPGCSKFDISRDYKRVAQVQDFFDIIYNVHVEMDGRGGKHAGQKRTYRAVADTYSFLPREAVTKFLMSCTDCQKRMHTSSTSTSPGMRKTMGTRPLPPTLEYPTPRHRVGVVNMDLYEDSMSGGESVVSKDYSSATTATAGTTEENIPKTEDMPTVNGTIEAEPAAVSPTAPKDVATKPTEELPMALSVKTEIGQGHPERKRRASDEISVDSCTTKTSDGIEKDRDDEDDNDNDDDDDEKLLSGQSCDPERLKAFNMFVRLFVDENLDRMVPISKQPKDKIQAILEACDRQFIEFHDRSRKRIRTYLKSCRRMRRSKDQNGWDSQMRPTPPHLTSAAAEQLLAQACENESINAKRMRMGLEPLPANWNNTTTSSSTSSSSSVSTTPPVSSQSQPASSHSSSSQTTSQSSARHSPAAPASSQTERQSLSASDYIRQTPPHAFRPPHELPSPFFSNGSSLFRPGFPTYQHPAHHHTPVIQHTPLTSPMQNGPTDLSMKSKNQGGKNQLNQSEVATIKQLIAGYRESAAFLYRSADELEQLLLQQN